MKNAGVRRLFFALCEVLLVWTSARLNGAVDALLKAANWLHERAH
jgi:hypothetical protein